MEYKKLPSSLELAALPTVATKRPPSYSDSFYIVKQPTSRSHFEFLDLATVPQESQELPTQPAQDPPPLILPTLPTPTSHPFIEIALGFLFHITLISLFESLFFYYFISRSEDKGILTTVNNLLNEVTATCPWPANQTTLLHDIFQLLVNQTAVQAAAATAAQSRTTHNSGIFLRCRMYVVTLL